MYIPRAFQETDRTRLLAFMQAHNFAVMTSVIDGQLMATHLPVVIRQVGDEIICTGHFAKANPHWRAIEAQQNLLIFTGPHAYITPTLYDKIESVPTWNYIAVHAYGAAHVITDPHRLEAVLYELIEQHEPSYHAQWDGLSDTYKQGMMQGIVPFEMVLERIEGKYKLSQNKTEAEQARIASALLTSDDDGVRATGAAMTR